MASKSSSELTKWLVIGGIAVVIIGFIFFSISNDRRGGTGECNNNYTGTCVPNVKYDIDCSSITTSVNVVGKDVYNFDSDNDGIGCEANSK